MTKDILESLVSRGISSYKMSTELNCSRSTIVHWLKKYNLKTICKPGPISKRTRNFCGNCGKIVSRCGKRYCDATCYQEYRYKSLIIEWQSGTLEHRKNFKVPGPVRTYLFKKYGSKCCLCGWAEVNLTTGKIPLEVDHIDGDWRNNIEENFRLVCPNCHSLTSNYKALNIGNGRSFRYKTNAAVA